MKEVILLKKQNETNFGLFLGDDYPTGVYVVSIELNTAAWRSGISPGDKILTVNGVPIRNFGKNGRFFLSKMASKSEILFLTVAPFDLKNFLRSTGFERQRTEDKSTQTENLRGRAVPKMGTNFIGKTQTEKRFISIGRRKNFNGFGCEVEFDQKNFRIRNVEPSSPAQISGLRIGDVILQVENQSTSNMSNEQFSSIVRKSKVLNLIVENRLINLKNTSVENPVVQIR